MNEMNALKTLSHGISLRKSRRNEDAKEKSAAADWKPVRVKTSEAVSPISSFKGLPFKSATPIQSYAIPILLEGRDLLACAPTGSGKTLAYLLPIMKLCGKARTRALVVCPTRELAHQIHGVALTLPGSKTCPVSLDDWEAETGLLVSTPGRLAKMDGLDKVRHLILDEADSLFETNFLEQTDTMFAACSKARQTALFSATLPSSVEEMARTVTRDAIRVIIGAKDTSVGSVEQSLLFTGGEKGKLLAIRNLLRAGEWRPPVLIFCQSIERARVLHRELKHDGMLQAEVMSADRPNRERDEIMRRFGSRELWCLICTDLMARGMDFPDINLIINYDLPTSVQSYIHRVGRAGRAGKTGRAITFWSHVDREGVKNIVNVMQTSGIQVHEWMKALPNMSKDAKKQLKKHPVSRPDPTSESGYERRKRKNREEMIEASKRRKSKQITEARAQNVNNGTVA